MLKLVIRIAIEWIIVLFMIICRISDWIWSAAVLGTYSYNFKLHSVLQTLSELSELPFADLVLEGSNKNELQ